MLTAAVLGISAFITSGISTITGMGGSIIFLAIMLVLLPPHIAIPLHAAVQIISNGSRISLFWRSICWKTCLILCIPAVVGIVIGRQFVTALNPNVIRIMLALFILFSVYFPTSKNRETWPRWSFAIAGGIGGTITMLIGAIDPIIAPFFLHSRLRKEELIATKACCQAIIHFMKIIGFGTLCFTFQEHVGMITFLGLLVIVGSYVGQHLLQRISERHFVIAFKTLLTLTALQLIFIT